MRSKKLISLFVLALFFAGSEGAQAAEKIITIGTAGVTGVYYPAGGAICRLVNRARKETNLRCTVQSTGGSVNNFDSMRKNHIELGIVQSDLLYQAYTGSDVFSTVGPDRDLRVVFFLHSEPFTVVSRADANIVDFDDLKGKRIYLGAAGSGQRATMEELMRRKGWTDKSVDSVSDIQGGDAGKALCAGKIDALVFAGGHPNGTIQQMTSLCPTRLVNVNGPMIDKMIAENPLYSRAVIPGGMYSGNPKPVNTFGVKAVLVAPVSLNNDIVYQVVKAVFDNLDNFKTLHPVFAMLDAQHMAEETAVPLHPGALKYYKEKGLAK
jgi:TRAP transporter TAXI family solute receptor